MADRRQRVVEDGEVSDWSGSVLEPLLFLIYIRDLEDNITSNVLKFADDTKVFRKVNSDYDTRNYTMDVACCKYPENT